jgi:hypothetical protein
MQALLKNDNEYERAFNGILQLQEGVKKIQYEKTTNKEVQKVIENMPNNCTKTCLKKMLLDQV